jgi:peptide/nickel transport system substrate-binding protein
MHNLLGKFASFALGILLLSGCATANNDSANAEPIVFGTMQCCTVLDPSNTFSSDEWVFLQQIYPALFNVTTDSDEIQMDVADSEEFVTPTQYRITVKPDLKFSSGHTLDASDVVFSLTRQKTIDSPNGPASLLRYVNSVTLVDDLTLDLDLQNPNDQTIKKVLASMVGLIVDEEVFSATEVTDNQTIFEGASFFGPYSMSAFEEGSLMVLVPNTEYAGVWGQPQNSGVIIRSYQSISNLIADFELGVVDLFTSYRKSLEGSVYDLASKDGVNLIPAPSTEFAGLYLNNLALPFGDEQSEAGIQKAKAVRQALQLLVDQEQLASQAWYGLYTPMHNAVPEDISGIQDLPNPLTLDERKAKSSALLEEAGVTETVNLSLLISTSKYGDLAARISTLLESQIESTGKFSINIEDLEWQELKDRRKEGSFDLHLFSYGADFADSDNYLSPIATSQGRYSTGYSNTEVDGLVLLQVSEPDADVRSGLISAVIDIVRDDAPYIPLASGGPAIITHENIAGTENFVSREFKFLFVNLSRK